MRRRAAQIQGVVSGGLTFAIITDANRPHSTRSAGGRVSRKGGVALRLIISIITGVMALSGCGPAPRPTQDTQAVEEVRRAAAQRNAEERQQAEVRLREQEARTSRWQFATVLAVSVSAFALIIGTILGSRARHDGER